MSDKILTVAVSNRDRMAPDNNATKLWVKSIVNQTSKQFNVIVVDGGSKNFLELKSYLAANNILCIQHIIGEKFHRGLLNNVGVRNATTPYIMTSDADMFFAPNLFATIISCLNCSVWIQSRTLYWKSNIVESIYNGKIDPFKDLESCKHGRIKKRTTAGACQCGHIDIWNKIRGYNEEMIGWGSEDQELLKRVSLAGYKITWIGESRESIMLFHQPHAKPNYKQDMEDQSRNKIVLNNVNGFTANSHGWGGQK